MKNTTLILLGLFLISHHLHAKAISRLDARNSIVNWLYAKKTDHLTIREVIGDTSLSFIDNSINDTMYVITLEPSGWVLLAADDIATPILAYSFESDFNVDDMPNAVAHMFINYRQQILNAKDKGILTAKPETADFWRKFAKAPAQFILENEFNTSDTKTLSGLSNEQDSLLMTRWGEGLYYNAACPTEAYGPGGRAYAGTAATAMAQIMKYYTWPDYGSSTLTYNDTNEFLKPNTHYNLNASFGSTLYNYNNMPTGSLTGYNSAVAQLIYHAGVSVRTDYGYADSTSIGSRIEPAMEEHFNYQAEGTFQRGLFGTNSDWHSKIMQHLRRGYPVIYWGESASSAPEQFIIDGFDIEEDDRYHINFGIGGSFNGYYCIDDITPDSADYTFAQAAIFNLKPYHNQYNDPYEQDDSFYSFSYLPVNTIQRGHSINPATDQDWISFYNEVAGVVTIETLKQQW